ncbi:MAG: terminase [Burkholderiales bacterium]|jgi:hypothetical protein|nr:terminase [Burkholderiales bacterium]
MGRNRSYDRNACVAEICRRLALGEPLTRICADDGMPDRNTVMLWEDDDDEIASQVARAREKGADALMDQARIEAETMRPQEIETVSPSGKTVQKKDNVDRSKLIVWTLHEQAKRINPKKYGDKQSVELTGAGGKPLDDAVRAQRIAAIMAKALERAPAAVASAVAEVMVDDGSD